MSSQVLHGRDKRKWTLVELPEGSPSFLFKNLQDDKGIFDFCDTFNTFFFFFNLDVNIHRVLPDYISILMFNHSQPFPCTLTENWCENSQRAVVPPECDHGHQLELFRSAAGPCCFRSRSK